MVVNPSNWFRHTFGDSVSQAARQVLFNLLEQRLSSSEEHRSIRPLPIVCMNRLKGCSPKERYASCLDFSRLLFDVTMTAGNIHVEGGNTRWSQTLAEYS